VRHRVVPELADRHVKGVGESRDVVAPFSDADEGVGDVFDACVISDCSQRNDCLGGRARLLNPRVDRNVEPLEQPHRGEVRGHVRVARHQHVDIATVAEMPFEDRSKPDQKHRVARAQSTQVELKAIITTRQR
jgi:hypothetical protein